MAGRWALLALMGFLAAGSCPAWADRRAKIDKCSLELAGNTIAPVRVRDKADTPEIRVGKRRFVLDRDTITELGDNANRAIWTIKSADGRTLRWLDASQSIAYFEVTAANGTSSGLDDGPVQVRRLDLLAKKWLPPLVVPVEKTDPDGLVFLEALIAQDKCVAIFLAKRAYERATTAMPTKLVASQLAFFREGKEQPEWSRSFPSPDARVAAGVHLWKSSDWPEQTDEFQRLVWAEEQLLICGSNQDNIAGISLAGSKQWRLPRIWEYQRDYIGPSVFAHIMAPLGRAEWAYLDRDAPRKPDPHTGGPGEDEWEKYVEAQNDFDRHFKCCIVGGPVPVPFKPDVTPAADQFIYVAVAKGPADRDTYWGALAECIIYELDGGGRVQQMTTVPRMVIGNAVAPMADGVVWACQDGAMLKLSANLDRRHKSGRLSGIDLLSDIAWYRQMRPPAVNAWLTTGKAADAIVFNSTTAFRTLSGGYIINKNDAVYHFPITLIDLQTGADRTMVLHVPLNGPLPAPTLKESVRRSPTGEITMREPYLVAMPSLDVHENELTITLEFDGQRAELTFDVGKWIEKPAP